MCLAQGHNAVSPVRLEPAAPQPQVKHSVTTESLRSHRLLLSEIIFWKKTRANNSFARLTSTADHQANETCVTMRDIFFIKIQS